ncbi:hypothetical protein [Neptuniibacter marinus]|uniref:hypothetical protein n=1 Tax=Neptuniibacter marinus TaxID=1806670 RepID=UPI000835C230|nr:hypothetical protein [Neptuniibacter marinus]
MAKNHLSEKLQKKIDKEKVLIKENNVRFTVTHLSPKGKVLGREWYKGFTAVTDKRLILVSNSVKFLNLKGGDDRFSTAKFIEDNVACLEVEYFKEIGSHRCVEFHIYTDKVDKFLKQIEKLS